MSSGDNVDIGGIAQAYNPSNGDMRQIKEKGATKIYKKTTSTSNPFLKQARYRRSTASASDTSSTDDLSPTACDPPMITNRFIGSPRHVTPYRVEHKPSNGHHGHHIRIKHVYSRKKEMISPYSGNSESNTNSLSPSRHSSFSSFTTTSPDNFDPKLSGHTLNSPVSDKSGYSPSSEGYNDDWKDNHTASSVTPCQADATASYETDSNHTLNNDLAVVHLHSNGLSDSEPAIVVNGNSMDHQHDDNHISDDAMVNGSQQQIENGQHQDLAHNHDDDYGDGNYNHNEIQNDQSESNEKFEDTTMTATETMETIIQLNEDLPHADQQVNDESTLLSNLSTSMGQQVHDQDMDHQILVPDTSVEGNDSSALPTASCSKDEEIHDNNQSDINVPTISDFMSHRQQGFIRNNSDGMEVIIEENGNINSSSVEQDAIADDPPSDQLHSLPIQSDSQEEANEYKPEENDLQNNQPLTDDATPVSDLIKSSYQPTASLLQQIYDLEQEIMDVAVQNEQELNQEDDMVDLDFQRAPIPENMNDALRFINKLSQQIRELRRRNTTLVNHITNKNAQLRLTRQENLLLLAERRKMIEKSSKIGIDVHVNLDKTTPFSQFKFIRDERKRLEEDDHLFQHQAIHKTVFESVESVKNVFNDPSTDLSVSDEQVLLTKDDPLLSQDSKGNHKQPIDIVMPSSSHPFDHRTIVNSALNSYGMEDLNLDDDNGNSTRGRGKNYHPSLSVSNNSYLYEPTRNYNPSNQDSHGHHNDPSKINSYTSCYNEESDMIQSSLTSGLSPSTIPINVFDTSPSVENDYLKALKDNHLPHNPSTRNEGLKEDMNDDNRASKYLNMEKSSNNSDFNLNFDSSLPRTDYSAYESPRYHDQQSYTSPRQVKLTDSTSYGKNGSPRGWPSSPISEGEIRVGSMVRVNSALTRKSVEGVVKYKGSIGSKYGVHFGILLDTPDGNSDGKHDGKRYFYCKPGFGIFVPFSKIVMIFK